MKLRKRIAAAGAAVMMIVSVSGIGASAATYTGGANKNKDWLTAKGNACYRTVKSITGGGSVRGTIKASYTPSVGVKCTSYGSNCKTHYARVSSGGRCKEGRSVSSYWFSETGCVTLKNNNAGFEGWYKT